jgi:hypothetical protein
VKRAGAAILICLLVLAVYGRTAGYGLFSDDFNWLVGAQVFDAGALFDFSYRTHFFRPVVELYFPVALAACGRSAECYHWLNIALHACNALLIGSLAALVSKTRGVGVLAGVLFAVMPGPAEAVAWVACVPEVLGAGLFVLTLWLYRRAVVLRQLGLYAAATLGFVACLLTHESGVTLLPILFLSMWLLPPAGTVRQPFGQVTRSFAPFVVVLIAYLIAEYVINSRNYLVTEGQYGLGAHMLWNPLKALAALAVFPHRTLWLFILAAAALWAVFAAPPRVRFYTLWTLITLAPVAGFRGGLSSRYLYLPAMGFAALTAEALWSARGALRRWPRAGLTVWSVLAVALTLRFETFAVKNARVWRSASVPFSTYAAQVRQLYPSPARGATLEVPTPPEVVLPQYLPALLQWEYEDVTLQPVVRKEPSNK